MINSLTKKKVRTKDKVFENICHLIQYHQDNNIPIISKDNELLLENPVYKNNLNQSKKNKGKININDN